jgi:hypothetical protein
MGEAFNESVPSVLCSFRLTQVTTMRRHLASGRFELQHFVQMYSTTIEAAALSRCDRRAFGHIIAAAVRRHRRISYTRSRRSKVDL